MKRFISDVENLDSPNEDVKQPKINRAELHCVPVCVSPDFNRVLIAKRPSTKNLLPDHWEFGCGQLDEGQTIDDCLAQTCREDFDLQTNRDYPPIPLGIFSFSREEQGQEQKNVPGVTFAVLCKSDLHPQNKKHAAVRWISREELESFTEKRVPDFDSTVPLAIKRAKEQWEATT
jgi:isopentenyldiphosphate isomerase